MDGVTRCTRYAFGPNRLHMCGPDMNREVLAYMNEGVTDTGLTNILKEFQALHPYLTKIAHTNQIKDPFDSRVVEAYWIGNELLRLLNNHGLSISGFIRVAVDECLGQSGVWERDHTIM